MGSTGALVSRIGAGQVQGTAEGIAEGWDQMALGLPREEGQNALAQTAHDAEPSHRNGEELCRDLIDVHCGPFRELDGDGIALTGLGNHGWSEACIVARCGGTHPAHYGIAISLEAFKQQAQQTAPGDQAIVRPQDATHSFASKPGAAALVGDGKPPAAHPVIPTLGNGPAHASCAHNDNAAIPASVCTHAGSASVAGKDHSREWERHRLSLRQRHGLASASQGETGDDLAIAIAQARLVQTLVGGGTYRGQTVFDAKPEICWSRGTLTEHPPMRVREAGATPRTSPIDAQQQ